MIHPTRTNLLLLREKSGSVQKSAAILRARRKALIREMLACTTLFLASRDAVQSAYGRAIRELALSVAIEEEPFLDSIQAVADRNLGIEIVPRSVMGLHYREVLVRESPLRQPGERGYDYRGTTPRLEESLRLFEQVLEAMLEIAAYESRLKRLAEEIQRVTRRIRVLEERVMPVLGRQIRGIAHFLGEREREAGYRLKRFREIGER
ncbi:MAG TPA: V-type ATP synthase subunit D [Geobacteraceae bacterium]